MTKTINFDLAETGKPKFQLMVDRLEAAVGDGQWRPGDRLPSNRELAGLFGVTVGTVSKAMSEAVRRGIVDTRVGSGTYIREPRAGAAFGDSDPRGARTIDLSLNVLPVSPVQSLLQDALAAYAQQKGSHRLFAYEEVQHRSRYQQTAAAWLASVGTPAQPHQIIVTNGVHHGLLAALSVLVKPGESALCDALCYTGFQRVARLLGVRLIGVACDHDGMDPDCLDKAIRASGAKVLIANPVLQNPMANTMPADRRAQIAAICRQHDIRVIEDGINAPLADPDTPSLAALMPDRTVHLAGFSKTVASGFRLGYASMPAAWLEAFQESVLSVQWFAPGFFADLLEIMQSEGLLSRCVQAHRLEVSARQQLLRELVPQAVVSAQGYHAWLPCSAGQPSERLCEQARRQGVSLSAGRHFAVDPDAVEPDGARISLGSCEDRAELRRGISVVARLLQPNGQYSSKAAAPAV